MQEKLLIERLGEPDKTTQPIENQRQRILTYTDAFVSFGSGAPRVDYLVNIHTDRVECVMTEIPADSQEDAEKLRDTIIGMILEHYHAVRFLLTESDIPDGCCICLKGVGTLCVDQAECPSRCVERRDRGCKPVLRNSIISDLGQHERVTSFEYFVFGL